MPLLHFWPVWMQKETGERTGQRDGLNDKIPLRYFGFYPIYLAVFDSNSNLSNCKTDRNCLLWVVNVVSKVDRFKTSFRRPSKGKPGFWCSPSLSPVVMHSPLLHFTIFPSVDECWFCVTLIRSFKWIFEKKKRRFKFSWNQTGLSCTSCYSQSCHLCWFQTVSGTFCTRGFACVTQPKFISNSNNPKCVYKHTLTWM